MSEVTFKVSFASGPRKATRPPTLPAVATDADASTPAPSPAEKATPRPPCRAARMLALAYLVERKVESGEIKSYAEAARLLGVSRARMAQVMALTNLSCQVQESILLGMVRLSERRLRNLLCEPSWQTQGELLTDRRLSP